MRFIFIFALCSLMVFLQSYGKEIGCSENKRACVKEPTSCPKGEVLGKGTICNFCTICLKELGKGDACVPHIGGKPKTSDSICGKGLKCCDGVCIKE